MELGTCNVICPLSTNWCCFLCTADEDHLRSKYFPKDTNDWIPLLRILSGAIDV